MAGKEGSAPERMKRVCDELATLVERDVEALKAAPAPTTHADAEKAAKSYRALTLAARSLTDLAQAVDRAMAREADQDIEEDDDDPAELDPEVREAMQIRAERLYTRFDREPADAQGDDAGAELPRPSGVM